VGSKLVLPSPTGFLCRTRCHRRSSSSRLAEVSFGSAGRLGDLRTRRPGRPGESTLRCAVGDTASGGKGSALCERRGAKCASRWEYHPHGGQFSHFPRRLARRTDREGRVSRTVAPGAVFVHSPAWPTLARKEDSTKARRCIGPTATTTEVGAVSCGGSLSKAIVLCLRDTRPRSQRGLSEAADISKRPSQARDTT
jgi:hypothetical protein